MELIRQSSLISEYDQYMIVIEKKNCLYLL